VSVLSGFMASRIFVFRLVGCYSDLDFDCRELFSLLRDLLQNVVDPIRPKQVTSSSLFVSISVLFRSFAGDVVMEEQQKQVPPGEKASLQLCHPRC
jgi:hypothetical protein